MPRSQPIDVTPLSFVSASILGVISLALLVLIPPASADSFILRKPLIGSIFSVICIFGALAVVFPGGCNSILGAREKSSYFGLHSVSSNSHSLKGHHFNCERYIPHIVKLGERTLCAACSGLLLGAVAAILGSTVYFFSDLSLDQFSSGLLMVGMGFVVLGFIQFKFPGLMRLLINTLFVCGALLVLLAVDALLESFFIDLYVISLMLLWIMTRVLLSQWDHSRICDSCTVECELKK